jgi:GTP cyclohydrolase I
MSHPEYKSDPALGQKVKGYLGSIGLETPMIAKVDLSEDDKISSIKEHIAKALEVLGMDLSNDSLMDTPNRVAKMWVKEIFWGLDYNQFPKCTTI